MSFEVIPGAKFRREAKRLVKKYPSLKEELYNLYEILSTAPATGIPVGNDTYKIRLAIASKGKGKSGGARIITYVVTEAKEVYLLTIYDKAELATADEKTIEALIKARNNTN